MKDKKPTIEKTGVGEYNIEFEVGKEYIISDVNGEPTIEEKLQVEEVFYNIGGLLVTKEGLENLKEAQKHDREITARMMFGKDYKKYIDEKK